MIGWMGMPDAEYQNPTVESGWQHCLTVPCEISRDGTRLLRYPVPELEKLRQERVAPENAKVFDLEYSPQGAGKLVIRESLVVEWEGHRITLAFQSGDAGRTMRRACVEREVEHLRILADASSAEVFVNRGERVLSTRYYPAPEARGIAFTGAGEAALWAMGALEIQ